MLRRAIYSTRALQVPNRAVYNTVNNLKTIRPLTATMSSSQASSSKAAPAPRYQVVPAPVHRGMTVLDRDAFRIELHVLGVKVTGAKLGALKNELTKRGCVAFP
jgi:hypothetical protein